eukprot:TRINITY_DN6051_c0_g1_i1.p2 TRINITY_DN6051_c0_g1~~TRINITY_DN6051_c0_g1_i1.p2  ORF type:complete len:125 (-),score=40.54 TRINITY_DN6051_c0_g1_i1:65-439(-)
MAQTLHKTAREPWFSLLRDGRKTVEGRLNAGDCATLRPGDRVRFARAPDGGEAFTASVDGTRAYPSFSSMLCAEGLQCVLPGVASVEEGVAVYRQFYSEEQERQHGVLAIRLHLHSVTSSTVVQ